jgi:hypothetical protein
LEWGFVGARTSNRAPSSNETLPLIHIITATT